VGPGHPSSSIFPVRTRTALRAGVAILAFALLAAGCGGGDDAAAGGDGAATGTPTTPAATTPPATNGTTVATPGGAASPATGGATGTEVPGINEISNSDAAPGNAVKISAITPKAFAKVHCSKPILVVMYQPDSILDEALLREANAAAAQVKGVVKLVYTPSQVKAYGDLPSKLGLLSTPGLATVGRDGQIENFWTSFVDRSLILKSLQNAASSKACKVSNEDVTTGGSAPAPSALSNAAALVSGKKLTAAPGTTAAAPTGSSSTGSAAKPGTGSSLATTDGNYVPSSVPGAGAVDAAHNLASDANTGFETIPAG